MGTHVNTTAAPGPAMAAPGKGTDVLDSMEAGRRVVRGGTLRSAGYAATVGLSVLSAVLLTRHLGVVRFGEYTTVISLVTVVSAVTDAGMANVGIHEYAVRMGAERDALMRDLLGLRVALSVLGAALAVAFAVGAGYEGALLAGTLVAGLGTVALVWQHTFTIPLAATLRWGVVSSLEVARQVLTVAIIAGLVIGGAGLFPLLAVGLAVNLLLIPATAAFARGQISPYPSYNLRAWSSLLRPTISFSLATAVGTIYMYIAQILTSLVASHHQSGLFAVSFRVFIVLAATPGLLVGAALPLLSRAARDDRARLEYALGRIFQASSIVGVALVIGFATGARFVVDVVAGSHYLGAVPVLRIQVFGLLASFMLAGWGFALLSLGRYRGLLIANGAALAVSCALTAALASTHGAKGAALASVCGETTLAVGYLVALVRGHPELRPRVAVLVRVLAPAIPAAALAVATLVLGVPSVVAALAAVTVYAAGIILTGAMPSELIELIPGRRHVAAQ